MKKIFFAVFLFSNTVCRAQDPFFSQYNSNAIYLNPAFAGSFEKGIFTATYRDQWPEFYNAYQTLKLSFNKYYSKIKGGIGINYFYDRAGNSTINTHNVQLMYAPHFQLKNSLVVKPGISFGYAYKTLDFAKLRFGDMIDPRYGFIYPSQTDLPKQNVSYFDFSSGILVYNKFFSCGAAFNHINEPQESFFESGNSKLHFRYTVHGSVNFSVSDKDSSFRVEPSVVYTNQGNSELYKVGITMRYSCMLFGAFYQENFNDYTDKVIGGMIGYQSKQVRLGYCYDNTIGTYNLSSHEFFISYSLPNKKQKTEGMIFNNSFAF